MTGADFLQLSPGAAPVRGLTGWLADAIRAAIMDGRLGAGTPLPATRLLAGDHDACPRIIQRPPGVQDARGSVPLP